MLGVGGRAGSARTAKYEPNRKQIVVGRQAHAGPARTEQIAPGAGEARFFEVYEEADNFRLAPVAWQQVPTTQGPIKSRP